MIFLKQSTAFTWKAGPFLDDTDGKTAETALSIAQADIRLSKNGGDIAQSHNSAGATHDEIGFYDVPLDTTDTETAGVMTIAIHKSGALPVWETFTILPANVYDSLFSTDKLEVDVAQWKGSTAPDMTGDPFARLGAPAGASIAADIAANQAILASGTHGNSALKTLIDAIQAIVGSGTYGNSAINTKLGSPAGASISADIAANQAILASGTYGLSVLKTLIDAIKTVVDAVKAKTDNLPAAPADDTSIDSQLATIDGILDNIYTAFALNEGSYRLTAAALALAPGGGESYEEILAIMEKFDGMIELVEGAYAFTEEALISSPAGTGGFTAADRVKLYALVTQIAENRAASAFSYSDESTDPIHKLRRMIGDTNADDILLTDGELTLIMEDHEDYGDDEVRNLDLAAAIACEEIAAKFARMAAVAVGDLNGQILTSKSSAYLRIAKTFRARLDGGKDEPTETGPEAVESTSTTRQQRRPWNRRGR